MDKIEADLKEVLNSIECQVSCFDSNVYLVDRHVQEINKKLDKIK